LSEARQNIQPALPGVRTYYLTTAASRTKKEAARKFTPIQFMDDRRSFSFQSFQSAPHLISAAGESWFGIHAS
jgi:hypothetical protein